MIGVISLSLVVLLYLLTLTSTYNYTKELDGYIIAWINHKPGRGERFRLRKWWADLKKWKRDHARTREN